MEKYRIYLETDKINPDSELYTKIDALAKYFTGQYGPDEEVSIRICDESKIPEIYNRFYAPGNDVDFHRDNVGIYSHRAFVEHFARNICIYYTKYETPDSILWLLTHEFAHYHIHKSYVFSAYMRYKNQLQNAKYDFDPCYSDDLVHEMHFEERFCNDIANFKSGDGGSDRCFDRVWWRNQKAIAARAGEGAE